MNYLEPRLKGYLETMSRTFFDKELLTDPGDKTDFNRFAKNVILMLKQIEDEYVDKSLIQLEKKDRVFYPEEWMELLCEELLIIPKDYWEEVE